MQIPHAFERAFWIDPTESGSTVFQLNFSLDRRRKINWEIAAVPGFKISADSKFLARSSIQYTRDRCFLESFTFEFDAGSHVLEILVVDYQGFAPLSRMDLPRGLFLCAPDFSPEKFDTGHAPWRCRRTNLFSFTRQEINVYQCIGGVLHFDRRKSDHVPYAVPHRAEPGFDADLFRQTEMTSRKLSRPAIAPLERTEIAGWEVLCSDDAADGTPYRKRGIPENVFSLPPRSHRRILIGLGNYYCFDVRFSVSGGSDGKIRVSSAESLFDTPECLAKGDRSAFDGKYFLGLCDCFYPGAAEAEEFFSFDYRSGRYVEIVMDSGDAEMELAGLSFGEHRYPLERADSFAASDPRWNRLAETAFRTLQMCAHDILMDGPYYEQLQYTGDGRLQLLSQYYTSRDLRLADHVMRIWAENQLNDGLFASIYPARTCQVIPGFSLIFLLAVCDYIRYRDKKEITGLIFPLAVRSLMAWENQLDPEGLLRIHRGWRFLDWVPGWEQGCPPESESKPHAAFNALYAVVLRNFAEICRWKDEPELAARFERKKIALLAAMRRNFYRPELGLYSDLQEKNVFSEHANSLMILAGLSPEEEQKVAGRLFENPPKEMKQTTLYFSFYYLEAAAVSGHATAFLRRMEQWFAMDALHFATLPETPEPSRSDCHGWSAHILYHLYASLAGLKPQKAGGKDFSIHPLAGTGLKISGKIPCGDGILEFSVSDDRSKLDLLPMQAEKE